MFDSILVPIDFNSKTDLLLKFVAGLKSSGLKEVTLVHVMDIARASLRPIQEITQGEIAEQLEEKSKIFKGLGITVHSEILEGKADEEILNLADKGETSLIVTGSHGKKISSEILKGSVSESLGRRSHIPVLVLHFHILEEDEERDLLFKEATDLFNKVLIPIDFTDATYSIIKLAKQLSKAGTKEAVLFHVVNKKGIEVSQNELELLEVCKESMSKFKDELEADSKIKVTSICRVGDPLTEIVNVSKEEDSTLIMVGSHGKGILKEWLIGSISIDLLRSAVKPTLIVHESK